MVKIFVDLECVCASLGKFNKLDGLNEDANQFLQILNEQYEVILCIPYDIYSVDDWLKDHEIDCYVSGIIYRGYGVHIDNRYVEYNGNYGELLYRMDKYTRPCEATPACDVDSDDNELLFKRITENLELRSDELLEHTLGNIQMYISRLNGLKQHILRKCYDKNELVFLTNEDDAKQEN